MKESLLLINEHFTMIRVYAGYTNVTAHRFHPRDDRRILLSLHMVIHLMRLLGTIYVSYLVLCIHVKYQLLFRRFNTPLGFSGYTHLAIYRVIVMVY